MVGCLAEEQSLSGGGQPVLQHIVTTAEANLWARPTNKLNVSYRPKEYL